MFQGKGKALVLGAAILVLGACTGRNHMVATAMDTNLALEQSTNEMLLLNIIRASQRKPMYFTALADISVTDRSKVDGSLTVPFGQAATHSYTFVPSFTLQAQPGFKVQILDNKAFITAIHTPVTLDTFALFLAAGWPKDFLLYMFTESLKVDGKPKPVINYSEIKVCPKNDAKAYKNCIKKSKKGAKKFAPLITKLKSDLEIRETNAINIIVSPVLDQQTVQHGKFLSQFLELRNKGYSLKNTCNARMIFTKEAEKKAAETGEKQSETDKKIKAIEKQLPCGRGVPLLYVVLKRVSDKLLFYGNCRVGEKQRTTKEREKNSECPLDKIVFRSPQGMLYFLGEITRIYRDGCQLEENKNGGIKKEECVVKLGKQPLFVLKKEVDQATSAITVTYNGESYGIPVKGKGDGFSLLALNLISQVISLQKDPKNIPKSSTINIFSN